MSVRQWLNGDIIMNKPDMHTISFDYQYSLFMMSEIV